MTLDRSHFSRPIERAIADESQQSREKLAATVAALHKVCSGVYLRRRVDSIPEIQRVKKVGHEVQRKAHMVQLEPVVAVRMTDEQRVVFLMFKNKFTELMSAQQRAGDDSGRPKRKRESTFLVLKTAAVLIACHPALLWEHSATGDVNGASELKV